MTALVGLIGKKRSGKDTFAGGLIAEGFTRYAFADPLKEAALRLDPLIPLRTVADAALWPGNPLEVGAGRATMRLAHLVALHGWEAAKEVAEVRRTLQEFGVTVREIDPEFWVRATLGRAVNDGRAVITDVRFPNEAAAIRRRGGVLIRIVRPGLVSTDEHVSETALDDYDADVRFYNGDTAEDLVARARSFARLEL